MKANVVVEDVGVGDNGAKAWDAWEYSPAHPKKTTEKAFMNWRILMGKKHWAQICRQNLGSQKELFLQVFLIVH